MLVLGGHDYYDSAAAFGIDKSIVFQRNKTQESKQVNASYAAAISKILPTIKARFTYSCSPFTCSVVVIIGGYFWRGICYRGSDKENCVYIWNFDGLQDVLVKDDIKLEINSFNQRYVFKAISEEYFGKHELPQNLIGLMIANQDTIVTAIRAYRIFDEDFGVRDIARNRDNLKDIMFYRACDAYQANQIITQWRSGVLSNAETKIAEISDIDKVAKHGFDKHSFRKLPVKKNKINKS